MTASACSKVVASTATYPHEVIRSHMHINGTASMAGLVDICKEVIFYSLEVNFTASRPPKSNSYLGDGVAFYETNLVSSRLLLDESAVLDCVKYTS